MRRWFHFRVSGVKGMELTLRITNAGQSSFPEAWPGYRACASYSKNSGWFRTDTSWDAKLGVITISLKSEQVGAEGIIGLELGLGLGFGLGCGLGCPFWGLPSGSAV